MQFWDLYVIHLFPSTCLLSIFSLSQNARITFFEITWYSFYINVVVSVKASRRQLAGEGAGVKGYLQSSFWGPVG